ncbi:MAG: HAD family hydrolase [Candidatus Omnitrophica bacterium]|nr:HAD family hydrolase [Candidatus Omnitrophota bacterium]MCM8802136.1 HAD family hydrolase [Candidatus Omnitrophota bacterium]
MKKKIAIFDLDGTLIDAYDSIYKTIDFISEKIKFKKFDYETVKRSVGGGDQKLILNLFGERNFKIAYTLYRENYLKFLTGNVKLLKGCIEILNELKNKGIKIALATNRSKFCLNFLLKKVKIENYFDIIMCIDDVKNPKPDPEIIFKILEISNFKKQQSFYVGDMDIDYLTGKNAGVDTYIVLTGSSQKDDFLKYENYLIFNNLKEVKKFLIENQLI